MDKQQYESLIEQGLSQKEIAKQTGLSLHVVKMDLSFFNLKTKCTRGRYSPKTHRCRCGETEPEKFVSKANGRRSRSLCKKCHNRELMETLNNNKAKAVALKGGKCEYCGYNKCLASLHFHHLDGNTKSKNWYTIKRNWEKFKKEIEGCVLLCANCHGEVTWGKDEDYLYRSGASV